VRLALVGMGPRPDYPSDVGILKLLKREERGEYFLFQAAPVISSYNYQSGPQTHRWSLAASSETRRNSSALVAD